MPSTKDPLRPVKDKAERKLARLIARLLAGQKQRVLDAFPNELDWDAENLLFVEQISPLLAEFVGKGKLAVMGLQRKQFDDVLKFVRKYAFDLIKGIVDETREIVRAAITSYYTTTGMTLGQVADALLSGFSANRVEKIAVTEVTRAFSEGQKLGVDEIRAQGLEIIEKWRTNRDGLVCEDCDREGEVIEPDGERPPQHPLCRCWTTSELA